VHTNEYYAGKAAEIAKLNVDSVRLKDSIGLLTPERTRTLVPAILKNLDGLPLEIHSHCTTGLAPLCYLEAIKLGVRTVHTASTPLANGYSLPSVENTLKNVRRLGHTAALDVKALEAIAVHFTHVARQEGKPMGVPVEYGLYQYEHQIPGGMRSNLESMLALRGESHRLEEVLEETIRVHKELGYPVMITPLSQLVGTQAVLNVVSGERYKVVPDEVFKYALGFYGKTMAPVDPDVLEKMFGSPRGKEFLNWQPPQPTLEELHRKFGGRLSDDQLLLQLMLPEESTGNILALMASPLKTEYPVPGLEQKEMALVRELTRWANLAYVQVQKGNTSITVQKSQH
jgi:oxaloacetate decarboxylase alpha subunit